MSAVCNRVLFRVFTDYQLNVQFDLSIKSTEKIATIKYTIDGAKTVVKAVIKKPYIHESSMIVGNDIINSVSFDTEELSQETKEKIVNDLSRYFKTNDLIQEINYQI